MKLPLQRNRHPGRATGPMPSKHFIDVPTPTPAIMMPWPIPITEAVSTTMSSVSAGAIVPPTSITMAPVTMRKLVAKRLAAAEHIGILQQGCAYRFNCSVWVMSILTGSSQSPTFSTPWGALAMFVLHCPRPQQHAAASCAVTRILVEQEQSGTRSLDSASPTCSTAQETSTLMAS